MFAEVLKELRTNSRINQSELADIVGVSKQCVSNWENGYIQPSIDTLVKIAKYFSVSTDYLLGLNSNNSIDVSGLTSLQVAHVKSIIDDLKATINKNS